AIARRSRPTRAQERPPLPARVPRHDRGDASGSMLRLCANWKQPLRSREPSIRCGYWGKRRKKGETTLRYRVNSPQVISETVGGETIIVNLATGHYFNLQGTAVDIWDGIVREEPTEAIAADLASRYSAASGEIAEAVDRLLTDLS